MEVSKTSPTIPEILTGIGNYLFGVKELLEDLTVRTGVQARMDGILFEKLENAPDDVGIFQLLKDYLRSF